MQIQVDNDDMEKHLETCSRCWRVDYFKYLKPYRQEIIVIIMIMCQKYGIPKFIRYNLVYLIVQTFYRPSIYHSDYFNTILLFTVDHPIRNYFETKHESLPLICSGINRYESKYQGMIERPCCHLACLYLRINNKFYCYQHFNELTNIQTIQIYKISVIKYHDSMFHEEFLDFIISFHNQNIVVHHKLYHDQIIPLSNRDFDILKCLNWLHITS